MLKSLSAIAEQNAVGTEQTASAVVIADVSDRLTELAKNLRATITRFQL